MAEKTRIQNKYLKSEDPDLKTMLLKVEDLINLAMGAPELNVVNFKMVQAILYILARQLRLLDQRVDLRVNDATAVLSTTTTTPTDMGTPTATVVSAATGGQKVTTETSAGIRASPQDSATPSSSPDSAAGGPSVGPVSGKTTDLQRDTRVTPGVSSVTPSRPSADKPFGVFDAVTGEVGGHVGDSGSYGITKDVAGGYVEGGSFEGQDRSVSTLEKGFEGEASVRLATEGDLGSVLMVDASVGTDSELRTDGGPRTDQIGGHVGGHLSGRSGATVDEAAGHKTDKPFEGQGGSVSSPEKGVEEGTGVRLATRGDLRGATETERDIGVTTGISPVTPSRPSSDKTFLGFDAVPDEVGGHVGDSGPYGTEDDAEGKQDGSVSAPAKGMEGGASVRLTTGGDTGGVLLVDASVGTDSWDTDGGSRTDQTGGYVGDQLSGPRGATETERDIGIATGMSPVTPSGPSSDKPFLDFDAVPDKVGGQVGDSGPYDITNYDAGGYAEGERFEGQDGSASTSAKGVEGGADVRLATGGHPGGVLLVDASVGTDSWDTGGGSRTDQTGGYVVEAKGTDLEQDTGFDPGRTPRDGVGQAPGGGLAVSTEVGSRETQVRGTGEVPRPGANIGLDEEQGSGLDKETDSRKEKGRGGGELNYTNISLHEMRGAPLGGPSPSGYGRPGERWDSKKEPVGETGYSEDLRTQQVRKKSSKSGGVSVIEPVKTPESGRSKVHGEGTVERLGLGMAEKTDLDFATKDGQKGGLTLVVEVGPGPGSGSDGHPVKVSRGVGPGPEETDYIDLGTAPIDSQEDEATFKAFGGLRGAPLGGPGTGLGSGSDGHPVEISRGVGPGPEETDYIDWGKAPIDSQEDEAKFKAFGGLRGAPLGGPGTGLGSGSDGHPVEVSRGVGPGPEGTDYIDRGTDPIGSQEDEATFKALGGLRGAPLGGPSPGPRPWSDGHPAKVPRGVVPGPGETDYIDLGTAPMDSQKDESTFKAIGGLRGAPLGGPSPGRRPRSDGYPVKVSRGVGPGPGETDYIDRGIAPMDSQEDEATFKAIGGLRGAPLGGPSPHYDKFKYQRDTKDKATSTTGSDLSGGPQVESPVGWNLEGEAGIDAYVGTKRSSEESSDVELGHRIRGAPLGGPDPLSYPGKKWGAGKRHMKKMEGIAETDVIKVPASISQGTGRGSSKTSLELVTQSQFALLEAAVADLEGRGGPPPTPSLPDNEQLQKDILTGKASLSDTMLAFNLEARIAAAEKAIFEMTTLITTIVSSGAVPGDILDQVTSIQEELRHIVEEARRLKKGEDRSSVIDKTAGKELGTDQQVPEGGKLATDRTGAEKMMSEAAMTLYGPPPQAGLPATRRSERKQAAQSPDDCVTYEELLKALQQLEDSLKGNIGHVVESTKNSAESNARIASSLADKVQVLQEHDDQLRQLREMVEEYYRQATGIDEGLAPQLENFQEQVNDLRFELDGALRQLEAVDTNVETAGIMELKERYKVLAMELDSTLHLHSKQTDYQHELNDELRSLAEFVEQMREEKADRDEVLDGFKDKADSSRLDGLLKESDFELARRDLEARIAVCNDKFRRQDNVWMTVVRDFGDIIGGKAEITQLDGVYERTQDQLQALYRKIQKLAQVLREPKAAGITRRLIRDGTCLSCREPVTMEPTEISQELPRRLVAYPAPRQPTTDEEIRAGLCIKSWSEPHIPEPEEDPRHACKRWTGGSHTVINKSVKRKVAKPVNVVETERRYMDAGFDGKTYFFTEPIYPCKECNENENPNMGNGNFESTIKAQREETVPEKQVKKPRKSECDTEDENYAWKKFEVGYTMKGRVTNEDKDATERAKLLDAAMKIRKENSLFSLRLSQSKPEID